MTKATFMDKRPQTKRKLSAEDKAEAERKERRKAVIKYATESLARKCGEHPGYTVGEPHPSSELFPNRKELFTTREKLSPIRTNLTVDDFPNQEDFNK